MSKPIFNHRADGRIEQVCEHGVGHTVYVPKKYRNQMAWWSHGCCGVAEACCKRFEKYGIPNEG